METMQAEYLKQNYIMSNTVSCDRTDGEIPAGIFTPNLAACSTKFRMISVYFLIILQRSIYAAFFLAITLVDAFP